MNRRKAIGGILALTGISYASVVGATYFKDHSNQNRGALMGYNNLIAELVDVIIPPTTTPGAKSAGVQDYVISYMEDCSSLKEYNSFLNGLKDLEEDCKNRFDCSFEECSDFQKNKLLENMDVGINSKSILTKIRNKLLGRSFFNLLKTLTIEGYCTSFYGVTRHLEYLPIPGKYLAVTKMKKNQKSWATK